VTASVVLGVELSLADSAGLGRVNNGTLENTRNNIIRLSLSTLNWQIKGFIFFRTA
jgi:hypothetical protein